MTKTDIQKIRQLLNQALKRLPHLSHDPNRDDSYCLIVKVLALLPCETCDGTGKKPKKVHCKLGYCIKRHDTITCSPNGVDCEHYIPSKPCPDCQPKENQNEA